MAEDFDVEALLEAAVDSKRVSVFFLFLLSLFCEVSLRLYL